MTSRTRRIGRLVLRILGALVALILLFAAIVYWKSERGIHQKMEVAGEELVIPTDAESIARGERLAALAGCLDCHGSDAGGHVFLRALPVMELHTPNLTTAGRTANWSGRDWARAVRHGVRPDKSVVIFMPTTDFRFMGDRDLGAIIAYLRSVPPVRRDLGPSIIGPVGRLLYVTGELPLIPAELTDHVAPVPNPPEVGPTVEYGAYLANGCMGCHGPNFSGGHIPGTPPEWPPAANLTADPTTGLGRTTEAQFAAAVTRGELRRGGTIDPGFMPWRQFARFSPDEVRALYLYFRTLPARPAGGR